MNILGVYYTNNKIAERVLIPSMQQLRMAANYTKLKGTHTITLALSAWEDVPAWQGEFYFKSFYRNNGHLNICMQILQVLYALKDNDYDYVCLLEHDVLYAPHYFEAIAAAALVNAGTPPVVINMNYVAMSPRGYHKQVASQVALSQIAMPFDFAVRHFEEKLRTCIKQGWCYLEPNYPVPDPKVPTNCIPENLEQAPNIHVNMNETTENHHFTNHYSTYDTAPFASELPLWGAYTELQIF